MTRENLLGDGLAVALVTGEHRQYARSNSRQADWAAPRLCQRGEAAKCEVSSRLEKHPMFVVLKATDSKGE